MDITSLSTVEKSVSGVRMNLIHPKTKSVLTHAESPDSATLKQMYLMLFGPDSPASKRAWKKIQTREQARADDTVELSDEELEAEAKEDAQTLAELTAGGEVFYKGEWLTLTKDNSYEMYYALLPVRVQALKFITQPGNFIAG